MSPRHFTLKNREKIEFCLSEGYSIPQIAGRLGCHRTSVWRELRRNSVGRHYDADRAQGLACRRRAELEVPHKLDHPELRRYVIDRSMEYWSPEQISDGLRLAYPGDPAMRVSYETIYTAAYGDPRLGRILLPNLRHKRKKRKKRKTALEGKKGGIKGRVSIDERPAVVEERSRTGDLEGDTVVGCGHSGNIVTLVDRKSLFLFAALSPTKNAQEVAETIVRTLRGTEPGTLHTITFDNGTEFAGHADIAAKLGVSVYFAHPYCSNERARNENTNGLLRQYFPKTMRFDTIAPEQLQRAVDELNNRPRKTLNHRTPAEVFNQARVAFRV